MDRFTDSLLSGKTDKIPDEYDWFAPLLGDWDCDYYDEYGGQKRHVKGDWIFRRVLEGAGIQDIFIFPSRATKEACDDFFTSSIDGGKSTRSFGIAT